MKITAICILFFITCATSSWAQNHKVFCDKNEKYLKEEGTITNGKKEGFWKFYNKDTGTFIDSVEYENDVAVAN